MKNNKSVKFIIIVVVVAAILIGGYLFINERNQIAKINEEIEKINTTETIDQEIKTTGKYAEVEKGVKDYLTEYKSVAESLNELYQADEYQNILQISNYETDKPEFKKSLELLENIKDKQEETKEKLEEIITDEYISKKADELGLQGKYKETFIDIIQIQEEAKEILEGMEENEEIVDYIEKAIKVLKDNPTKWQIKDGQLQFFDLALMGQYNTYVNTINIKSLQVKK